MRSTPAGFLESDILTRMHRTVTNLLSRKNRSTTRNQIHSLKCMYFNSFSITTLFVTKDWHHCRSTDTQNKINTRARRPTLAGCMRENVQQQQQQLLQLQQPDNSQHATHVSRRHTYAFDDRGALFTQRHSMHTRGAFKFSSLKI